MDETCINPFCGCEPCRCQRPCTCGLAAVARTVEERWTDGELHHSVVTRYRPVPKTDSGRDGGHGPTVGPVDDEIGEPEDALAPSRDAAIRRDNVLRQYRRDQASTSGAGSGPHGQGGHGQGGSHPSVRRAEHRGHEIEVRTTYEVLIDGEPLGAHFGVSNDGTVHYHGLPNYSSASAIDLLKDLVDAFPDDYPPLDHQGHDDHDNGGEG